MAAILSKFTVLYLLISLFIFLELKLILFYNWVLFFFYYIRIFLILIPHPVDQMLSQ